MLSWVAPLLGGFCAGFVAALLLIVWVVSRLRLPTMVPPDEADDEPDEPPAEPDEPPAEVDGFLAFLETVPVEVLDAYPGIGPVTISKLRASGYVSLARLHRRRLRVPGLGQKRLKDVRRAVEAVVDHAREMFREPSGPTLPQQPTGSDLFLHVLHTAPPVAPRAPAVFPAAPHSAVPVETPVSPDQLRNTLEIALDLPLSADLIRRQYHRLMERYAPERAQAYDADFIDLARRKRAAVEAAARSLLAPLGEPLEKPEPPTPSDLRHNPDLDALFGD